MKLGLMLGAGMLAIGLMAQQTGGLYDLGKVWGGLDAATGGAASASASAVTSVASSTPVGLLYLATILFGVRVVMTAPMMQTWLQGRNAARQAELDERSKAAEHDRQMQILKVQHRQQIETLKVQADPTTPVVTE